MNNFTFSSYGLKQGYVWSLFFCHFAHTSFFSYFLDSLIIGLLCQSLGMMYGNVFLAKGMVLSLLFGSFLLFSQQVMQGYRHPYAGNDAILRGLIFSIIFSNPAAKLTLIPLPITVPAWGIAIVLLGLDLFQMNVAGFGGVTAAYVLVNGIIWAYNYERSSAIKMVATSCLFKIIEKILLWGQGKSKPHPQIISKAYTQHG